jgi:hypothetical protein
MIWLVSSKHEQMIKYFVTKRNRRSSEFRFGPVRNAAKVCENVSFLKRKTLLKQVAKRIAERNSLTIFMSK